MPGASRGWPDAAHEALLLAFIEEAFARTDAKKAIITGVTARMKEEGFSYSYDAVKYCFILSMAFVAFDFLCFRSHTVQLLSSAL